MSTPSTTQTIFLERESKKKTLEFDAVKIKLASAEEIISWSHGEVTKPETINYRSQKPERDGLFCQKIFGPVKDWECACGKYKGIRYRGIVCDRCGVEVTRSFVRRERMGHVKLAVPVVHIWFLRSVPSKIGALLNLSIKSLEKVVYFANFIITSVNENLREEALNKLEAELKEKKRGLKGSESLDLLKEYNLVKKEISGLVMSRLLSDEEYKDLSFKYGHIFEAQIGAEAVLNLLNNLDLKEYLKILEKQKRKTANYAIKKKIIEKIRLAQNFIENKIRPSDMVLQVLPVVPPDLRPLVELDGGRFASSDLNDLYRRVINRNNRLKKLFELEAPEVIIRNEKRMLQEATDALLDNSMRPGKTTTMQAGQKRPLKSLGDILRGKEGRFRRNLLGKRVDYSGRSVIVVGPNLKLHQCGLPKILALEIFKPFVASLLIKRGVVHNVRSANRKIDDGDEEVWATLEEVVKGSRVLLNRAPTLHRLSVQAFQPILVDDKTIQVHPLICDAFNADFDGDQMGVYLPISQKAKEEAKEIIASTKNLLKPATGQPVVLPTQDIILGVNNLTSILHEREKENLRGFSSKEEAINAYELGKISLQEEVKVKVQDGIYKCSVGRLIFGEIFPLDFYKLDKVVDKRSLNDLVVKYLRAYGEEKTVELLDKLKDVSFEYLTYSGITWSMEELPPLPEKKEILKKAEREVEKTNESYEGGLLTEREKYLKNIETWSKSINEVSALVQQKIDPHSSPFLMVNSGARGSWTQLNQMIGMKGLVASPAGKIIELAVRSSYKEGLDVLEYFISTHGTRKGIVDTALRTSSAGYLTRRLVDAAQEVLVTEPDCRVEKGIMLTEEENKILRLSWRDRIFGRTALADIKNPKTGKVIVKKGEIVDYEKLEEIEKVNPPKIYLRSVLRCKAKQGVCSKCYGYDLGFSKPIKEGVAVGIVAAQSIGEPGTQLTLRTFHIGGAAGKDITQGLPRAEEIFELRPPKVKALMALHKGKASIESVSGVAGKGQKIIKIKYQGQQKEKHILDPEIDWQVEVKEGDLVREKTILAESEKKKIFSQHKGKISFEEGVLEVIYEEAGVEEYIVPKTESIYVKEGEEVEYGQQLTSGSLDLRELYELRGREAVEKYMLAELQNVYYSQGVKLDSRHFEVIIRQMFSRFLITDSGETNLSAGMIISREYKRVCDELARGQGKKPSEGKELFLGITKAALSCDSWLSAASFQETSRILINAAIGGTVDYLYGLKENVIIGKLIPAGTGFKKAKK